ncbi:MAG TPA: glycosyltransferase family 39 protein [Burkholderiaceae bacterium]|nr:glycosyltransferase family 39 protein [Burkholderiaceae bacterium]
MIRAVPFSSAPALGERRAGVLVLLLVLAVSVYRYAAREALDLGLHFDEAQYWVWSLDPAFGYFSKPPVVAWAIGAARAVCGDGEACIRLPSLLALGLATLIVFALGRRLFDARTGFVAALLFLFAPLTTFLSWFITTDSLLLLAWAAALACLVRALEKDRLHWWVATGIAAGLGLMSKYTMGIFALSALGLLLTTPYRRLLARPGPYVGALVAALLFAPNIVWNITHQFATFGHTAHISQPDEVAVDALRALRFIGEQFGVFGPLAMVAFITAALGGSARPAAFESTTGVRAHRHALLSWFSWPFLLVITAQALAARAHANWAAPAYVGAALLAASWLAAPRRRGWLGATLAINVVVMLAFYHYKQVLPALDVHLRRDPVQQLQGWDSLGAAVAMKLDSTGARLLTDDRRLQSWLTYYAGPRAFDSLAWNPERKVDNHYRLLRDVAGAPRGPFLFVSEAQRFDELARQFTTVERLGLLASGPPCADAASGCLRRVFVYRLGDFRGYDAGAVEKQG